MIFLKNDQTSIGGKLSKNFPSAPTWFEGLSETSASERTQRLEDGQTSACVLGGPLVSCVATGK